MKVLFLTNLASRYRVDFFNELGKLCELTVWYEYRDASMETEKRDDKWFGLEAENFTQSYGVSFGEYKNFDIVIICGFSTKMQILSILYLSALKIPFYIEADGGVIRDTGLLKRTLKKLLLKNPAGCFTPNGATDDFLRYCGYSGEVFYRYPFTSLKSADILHAPVADSEKTQLKQRLSMKEEKTVLFVGSLIHRKGVDILIRAAAKFDSSAGVYIVGGQPTEELSELCRQLKLSNIHFIDFKEKEVLADYFKASDVFVLPTRTDIWGLVVGEAMSFALPVVTTDMCVAGVELIENGVNGFIFPVDDTAALSDSVNRILRDRDLQESMAAANLRKISAYTIENMAAAHITAFEKIMEEKKRGG
ncbi:MAG: glycosyltransferase family 4 protein [Oscillospiraceae bacterium]|jgi:glycosyltransferase involved in cell wall biosynthesis|nr:glycosyltransferase family 4 protein [Oscillospiraceae bacterium]